MNQDDRPALLGVHEIRDFVEAHLNDALNALKDIPTFGDNIRDALSEPATQQYLNRVRLMREHVEAIKHVQQRLTEFPGSQLLFFPLNAWNSIQDEMKFQDASGRFVLDSLIEKRSNGMVQPRLLLKKYYESPTSTVIHELAYLIVFEHESVACIVTQCNNLKIAQSTLEDAFKPKKGKSVDGKIINVYGEEVG